MNVMHFCSYFQHDDTHTTVESISLSPVKPSIHLPVCRYRVALITAGGEAQDICTVATRCSRVFCQEIHFAFVISKVQTGDSSSERFHESPRRVNHVEQLKHENIWLLIWLWPQVVCPQRFQMTAIWTDVSCCTNCKSSPSTGHIPDTKLPSFPQVTGCLQCHWPMWVSH
jgi:hypothetical protein